VRIPTNHGLALKSNLQLPWNKMRAIRWYKDSRQIEGRKHQPSYNTRWLKKFRVHLASERQQRVLVHEVIGDNIESEKGAFLFSNEDGSEEIR